MFSVMSSIVPTKKKVLVQMRHFFSNLYSFDPFTMHALLDKKTLDIVTLKNNKKFCL